MRGLRGFALVRRELQDVHADPVVMKELDRLEQQYEARGEAVDSVDRAEAEVERLREENEEHLKQWTRDIKTWNRRFEQEKEAFAAEHAEVKRLRAALERCLEKATKHDDGDIEDIARQALQPTKEQV